jgi:hypothetical protein
MPKKARAKDAKDKPHGKDKPKKKKKKSMRTRGPKNKR